MNVGFYWDQYYNDVWASDIVNPDYIPELSTKYCSSWTDPTYGSMQTCEDCSAGDSSRQDSSGTGTASYTCPLIEDSERCWPDGCINSIATCYDDLTNTPTCQTWTDCSSDSSICDENVNNVVQIHVDNYANEVSWEILDADDNEICSSNGESFTIDGTGTYSIPYYYCPFVSGETYTLRCFDSYGDGWQASSGSLQNFVKINNIYYCDTFVDGNLEEDTFTFDQNLATTFDADVTWPWYVKRLYCSTWTDPSYGEMQTC